MANAAKTLLDAYVAGAATWDDTMTALRALTLEEWGIKEDDDDDRPAQGDPDWWIEVENRAGGPAPKGGVALLTEYRVTGRITKEQWSEAYDLVGNDDEDW